MRQLIENEINHHGFQLFSISKLGPEKRFVDFEDWLSKKNHADMGYLENHKHCRQDPRNLLPRAQSAVVFGWPYFEKDTLEDFKKGSLIAKYSRLKDYHKLIKKKGEKIGANICSFHSIDPKDNFRTLVDSAPVLERALADKSSKGFIGKNTCFIHPQNGSFYLLGCLVFTFPIEADKILNIDPHSRSENGGCGSCKRCQTHCPTGALDSDYKLDARKCLSYWTIENKGPIPKEYWPYLKKYWYGCDLCQNVCPYNKNSEPVDKMQLAYPKHYDLYEVATMNQEIYEKLFGGSSMVRAKKEGLKRNALIAMWASKDKRLEQAIEHILNMSDEPVGETLEKTITQLKDACDQPL